MRHAVRIAAFAVGCSSIFTLSACGSQEIAISKSNTAYYKGAEIFDQRCSGCHSLEVVGAHGSATKAKDKEIADGPNFNQRRETEANVLYALRNGGFSGKIMPQNIVTGEEADQVARFLAKYAGADAKNPAAPERVTEESSTPGATAEGNQISGDTDPETDVTDPNAAGGGDAIAPDTSSVETSTP